MGDPALGGKRKLRIVVRSFKIGNDGVGYRTCHAWPAFNIDDRLVVQYWPVGRNLKCLCCGTPPCLFLHVER